jgi:hypothetical protein
MKKNHQNRKSLKLKKQTIVKLNVRDLAIINGGMIYGLDSFDQTSCDTKTTHPRCTTTGATMRCIPTL